MLTLRMNYVIMFTQERKVINMITLTVKEIQDIKEKEKKEHENDGSFNMDWKDR